MLAAAGLGVLAVLATLAFRKSPVPVDLVTVQAGPMRVTIDADGQTRIRQIYEIAAPIAGTALRAPVAVGDPVRGGHSIVARVEPAVPALLDQRSRSQAEAAIAEAEAALDLAQADLARAAQEAGFAATQSARTRALVERGVASVTRMESARQALALAEAALRAARARRDMAQGTLARARAALLAPSPGRAPDSCCVTLLAPADGVVLSVAQISEHPVQPGTPLVSIGDLADLEIVADLLSADAVRLAPGTAALVERWGGPEPLMATLDRIEPVAETRVSALGIAEQRVNAIFQLDSAPPLRASVGHGYAVFVRVILWQSEQSLQVPLGALFRREAGWAVFTVADGRAQERPVHIGQRGTATAEIRAGLAAGDVIITHPGPEIRDGVAVVDRRDH